MRARNSWGLARLEEAIRLLLAIRPTREARGLSRAEAARRLRVSTATFYRWEKGVQSPATWRGFRRLRRFLVVGGGAA